MKHIFFITSLIITFCSCAPETPQQDKKTGPKNTNLEEDLPPRNNTNPEEDALPKDNYFADKANWGIHRKFIDHEGKTLLSNDSRVNDFYKTVLPEFCQDYVLWRVTHDGSCWIQSAMVVLLHGLLSLKKDQFQQALVKWKNLATEYAAAHPAFKEFERAGHQKKFFDLLEALGASKNFKQAMYMLNHTEVKDLFNRSLRAFIDPEHEIHNLCELGDIRDAAHLASKVGVPFLGFAGDINATTQLSFVRDALQLGIGHADFKKLGKLSSSSYEANAAALLRNFIHEQKHNFPKVLYFRSNPLYMDIAVEKAFSDAVNAQ